MIQIMCQAEVVEFLINVGADVNAMDADGWTPLHCAASCNNLDFVRMLVEHGAAVFLRTNSDMETALEKCEGEEDTGCAECLYSECSFVRLEGSRTCRVARNLDRRAFVPDLLYEGITTFRVKFSARLTAG